MRTVVDLGHSYVIQSCKEDLGQFFYDSKLFLTRARDAGTLHWAALVSEIERTCDNIRIDELTGSTKRVSSVSRIA